MIAYIDRVSIAPAKHPITAHLAPPARPSAGPGVLRGRGRTQAAAIACRFGMRSLLPAPADA